MSRRDDETPTTSAAVGVSNPRAQPLRVIVEPWGRNYEVPAGGRRQFLLRGPGAAEIEFEITADAVLVYAWVGSTLDDNENPEGMPVPRGP